MPNAHPTSSFTPLILINIPALWPGRKLGFCLRWPCVRQCAGWRPSGSTGRLPRHCVKNNSICFTFKTFLIQRKVCAGTEIIKSPLFTAVCLPKSIDLLANCRVHWSSGTTTTQWHRFPVKLLLYAFLSFFFFSSNARYCDLGFIVVKWKIRSLKVIISAYCMAVFPKQRAFSLL